MAAEEAPSRPDPLLFLRRAELREPTADGRAAVLLDNDLAPVWANGAGARLLGANDPAALRQELPATGGALLRQAHSAARRALSDGETAEALVRTRHDFRTRLLTIEATPCEQGVLLLAEGDGRDEDALALVALDAANDEQAAAVLSEDGAVDDRSSGFDDLGLDGDVLSHALREGSDTLPGQDGRHRVRFADLGDGRHLVLVERAPEPERAAPVVAAAVVSAAMQDGSAGRRWFYRSKPEPEADVSTQAEASDAERARGEVAETVETARENFDAHHAVAPTKAAEPDTSEPAEAAGQDGPEPADRPSPEAISEPDEEIPSGDTGRPVGFLSRAASGVAATALGAAGLVRTVRQSGRSQPAEPETVRMEEPESEPPDPDEEERSSLLALDGATEDDLAEEEAAEAAKVGGRSENNDRSITGFVGAALYSAPPQGVARFAKAPAPEVDESEVGEPDGVEADAGDDGIAEGNEDAATRMSSGFAFQRREKATRFVWSIDEGQRFTSVSEALAEAVGPRCAELEGESWADVANRFGFDEDGAVADLLTRGDTWSGRTVMWPVEGESLRVPVDLAGLPAFDRDRQFTGFNGFGIVRTADAVPDARERDADQREPEDRRDESTSFVAMPDEDERPAAEPRALSSDDRETFERIGEHLGSTTAAPAAVEANRTAPLDFETPEPAELIEEIVEDGEARDEPEGEAPTGRRIHVAEVRDVDTSILARLPIPVLAYRGDTLLFANAEFARLTGYETLHDLADAGGVDALFGEHRSEDDLEGAHVLHRDGHRLAVEAHLQTVPWDHERAMLLTLKRSEGGEDDGPRDPDGSADDLSGGGEFDPAPTTGTAAERASRAWNGGMRRDGATAQHPFADLPAAALHDILDTATEGVLVLDAEGEVQALNRPAEALFGIDAADIVGEPFLRLLAPESHRSALDYLAGLTGPGVASVLNDGRDVIGRVGADLARSEDRGLLPLRLTIGRIQRDGDDPLFGAVLRDMTQWKKTEEDLVNARSEAERLSRAKSDFLTTVSHEVRTPLNAIIGFSEMMVEERFGPLGSDRYRGYVRDIRASGRHVLDIVNDLLDISKIEAGEMQLDFGSVALNTVVTETVAMSQAEANRERIVIRTSLSADLPPVVADERSMRQIVLNLLSNALRYTQAGGQVIVSTAGENGDVVLRVRDTGIGMDAEALEQALQPFRQATQSGSGHETGERGGTGLGLPLTKAMVEANRAHFSISSVPQEGTLVEMRFPPQRVLTH